MCNLKAVTLNAILFSQYAATTLKLRSFLLSDSMCALDTDAAFLRSTSFRKYSRQQRLVTFHFRPLVRPQITKKEKRLLLMWH